MSHMSGLELARSIVQINPTARIMVLTAFFEDMVQLPPSLRGFIIRDAILEKPLGLRKICEDVEKQLQIGSR